MLPTPTTTILPYTPLFRSHEELERRVRHLERVPGGLLLLHQGERSSEGFVLDLDAELAGFHRERGAPAEVRGRDTAPVADRLGRSEEHTSELQSPDHLVGR